MKKFNLILVLLMLIMLSTAADVEAYKVYYGQLHSHTKISDGTGTPLEAYGYARDVAGLDFFSIADHDYWPNDMTDRDWAIIKDAANSFNEDGVYTTFWGFEWTSDEGWTGTPGLLEYGHMAIINSDDYCNASWEETNEPNELVDWMSTMDCVAFFNHPGQYGFFGTDVPFDFNYSDRIVGMELWNRNGDYYSRTIPEPHPSAGNRWYDEALQCGFYIGASGSQDNHSANWGTMNEWRMAILAPELTRTSLLAAMRARRFYSTRDKNLVLSFTCHGKQMGSLIEGAGENLPVEIDASDGDNEIFSQIDLLKNGAVIQTWYPNTSTPSVSTTVSGALDDYFYVRVFQGGGWQAVSSPIFIVDHDVTPPTPDPMTWKTAPYTVSSSSIAMIATAATDLFSVEYYFACLEDETHDSGWQDSPIYTDTGLSPGTQYTYTVTARDKSPVQNMTGNSEEASATTDTLDIVTVIKAEYSFSRSELKVEATSSKGGEVTLTVVGYGDMTYYAAQDMHKYSDKPVANPGGTITITSTGGGEDTTKVTRKK